MSIRIGSSCALSIPMALGYAVETRILTDSTKWKEVSKYAIDNKQYLIVCPCVNDNMGIAHIPSDSQWQTVINDACKYLISIGGNYDNCKISIINEPTKWFRDNGGKERYTYFINLASAIVDYYGLRMGAGNMEFYDAAVLGDWYGYICANASFDDLDIHIQASCDSEAKTKKYTDYALGLATQYKKKLDCTEAFYGNITTSSGWNLINIQLKHAERIGCANFCNVFNNLDTSVFPILAKPDVAKKWYELCFKINGTIHSNYWAHWKILMDTKHPIPNINILILEEDDMKLQILKIGVNSNQVLWLQEILKEEYGFENPVLDGKFGVMTDNQVREYQSANKILVDGKVGKQTTVNLIEKAADSAKWLRKLQIYMAFEK